ncbi:MAG: DUF1553 domain-containing protein [Planctomycetota bacterium]|nr:MAG: DUF1553 domain-containing protein [Planctomycetota bacterium]
MILRFDSCRHSLTPFQPTRFSDREADRVPVAMSVADTARERRADVASVQSSLRKAAYLRVSETTVFMREARGIRPAARFWTRWAGVFGLVEEPSNSALASRCMHFRLCAGVRARFVATVAVGLVFAWAGNASAEQPARTERGTVRSAAPRPQNGGATLFRERVASILRRRCVTCHSGEEPKGGFRLTTREGLLKGGESGPAIDPAKPENSLLLEAINYETLEMPPQGRLPPEEIATLTKWVLAGAPWPDGLVLQPPRQRPAGRKIDPKTYWAFQPIRRPPVPEVKNRQWVRTPIDAFILARLEANGLKPAGDASRATVLRRAYYNLIGLPPSPEQVRAFLADDAPDAFERVVEELLQSPHYGEHWGRHWLDIVRFAETNSYERDGDKPHAWRYRDYVIESFNEDKPYDRFILEQLAGDELPDRTPETIIATGYYRLGIWDDEPADPLLALYDDLDDILTTTCQAFLGLTMNCARCHEHKLDPIPHRDYYRMLAFFNGVRRFGVRSYQSIRDASVRMVGTPEEIARHAEETRRYREAVAANAEALKDIEKRVRPHFRPVEKQDFKDERNRVAIMRKYVPQVLSEEEFRRYVALTEERDRLRRNPPKPLMEVLCVKEVGPKPRETFVLQRGNPHAPGEKVEPGFISCLNPPEPRIVPPAHGESCGRRLALAQWIASEKNPLTARVMANRIWQYHFGRGIVRTPNNFGAASIPPTHPELLDWLAAELIASGWRLKPLHRLIMKSHVYHLASTPDREAVEKDPQNDLFSHFDVRRLTAEEIRDSILCVNRTIDLQVGGPSIYTTIPREVLQGQSRPGAGWPTSPKEKQRRRSVYIFVKRSLRPPILEVFDAADTDFTCPVRFETTQPSQPLMLINSEFINEQARLFAEDLEKAYPDDLAAQVEEALWRVFQRPPSKGEIERGLRFVRGLRQDGADVRTARKYFCLMCLNLNEFLYVD